MSLERVSSTLNPKYFETLDNIPGHKCTYQVVRPKHSPMILFGLTEETGIPVPLASVHFLSQDYESQNDRIGNRGQTLITQRWKHSPMNCDFQGLITQDNQDYEFVLTNLTTGNDMININILKQNVKATETDPGVKGHGLNQVNEINPYLSYSVKCDQKDNRSLVLQKLPISVKEDEQSGPEESQGTYYWIDVIAPRGSSTAKLLKHTVWSCVDYFINILPEPITIPENCFRSRGLRLESASAAGFMGPIMGSTLLQSPGCVIPSLNHGIIPSYMSNLTSRDLTSPEFLREPSMSRNDDNLVEQSHATQVASGRYIPVDINHTNIGYDFETHSRTCCLGLSISSGLQFYPEIPSDTILTEARLILEDYKFNQGSQYLQKLTQVYKEENCVICLESQPNTVIYSCGHQCCHQQCLKSDQIKICPLCRGFITAMIPL